MPGAQCESNRLLPVFAGRQLSTKPRKERTSAFAPDLVWVSDITYLPLATGEWGYLATWMDLYSRRIVGWRVGETMEDELVILPLRRALQVRQPATGLIIHSDRGGQYVSTELKELVHVWRIRPSMSRADDPYENAFAESLWIGPISMI